MTDGWTMQRALAFDFGADARAQLTADEYVSAVLVDIFKRLMPKPWASMPYFRQAEIPASSSCNV